MRTIKTLRAYENGLKVEFNEGATTVLMPDDLDQKTKDWERLEVLALLQLANASHWLSNVKFEPMVAALNELARSRGITAFVNR